MKITNNTVVSLTYNLTAGESGSLKVFIEKTDAENPFTFLFGTGQLIASFEKNIASLGVGETFDFEIAAKDAYGIMDNESIVPIPKHIFESSGEDMKDLLSIGKVIPMSDEHGNRMNGKVIGLQGDDVIMDFNHPLAGKDLNFKGVVLEVRMATAQELEHGHVHHGGHNH